jgi:hypothetical protein
MLMMKKERRLGLQGDKKKQYFYKAIIARVCGE